MFFLLRFPKMVEIQNPRLIILYFVLQACTLAVLIWWFFSQRFYEKTVDIGSFISATMNVWDEDLKNPAFRREVMRLQQSRLCTHAEDHEFWFDPRGINRFSNATCAIPCVPQHRQMDASTPQERPPQDCASTYDGYMTKGDSEVFIPTSRTRVYAGDDGKEFQESEFILTADAMTINFGYYFDIPLYRPSGTPGFERYFGSNRKEVSTEVRDMAGNLRKTVRPGQPIEFTVTELLDLAGHAGALDKPHEVSGTNQKPGSSDELPIGRISGFELMVNLRCAGEVGQFSHEISSCSLTVQKTERPWTFERVLNFFGNTGDKLVLYNGVRIRMRAEGEARHWDAGMFLSRLTTCLVLLTLPRRFIMVVCTHVLGHLSTIYKQAIYDKFDLKDAIAGMSARLLVWNASFVDLVDKELKDGTQGISKSRMHERLIALLRTRHMELDAGEIHRLCNFTYEAMLSLDTENQAADPLSDLQDNLTDVTAELGLSSAMSAFRLTGGSATGEIANEMLAKQELVNSDRFSCACTSNENLNFDAVVKLFDKERRRWFMERLFTPKAFSEIVKYVDPDQMTKKDDDSDITVDKEDHDHALASVALSGLSGSVPMSPMSPAAEALPDPNGAFTLEEERELRKNLHKRVTQLVQENRNFRAVHQDLQRTVEDHRHHFDSRHREHFSKVLATSEEAQKRIEEANRDWLQRHQEMQDRAASIENACQLKQAEIEDRMRDVQRGLEEKLQAMENLLRSFTDGQAEGFASSQGLTRVPDGRPPSVSVLGAPVASPSSSSGRAGSPSVSGHQLNRFSADMRERFSADLRAGSLRFSPVEGPEVHDPLPPQGPQGVPSREPSRSSLRANSKERVPAPEASQDPPSPWKPLFMATLTRPRK